MMCGIAVICWEAGCRADTLYQVFVDLDGDGKVDPVAVELQPRQAAGKDVVVKIGNSRYLMESDSGGEDLPDIKVGKIDQSQPYRQLVVRVPSIASCNFHVLGLINQTVIPLLNFDSGPLCDEPRLAGNGEVFVRVDMGFWFREERYRLNAAGSSLRKESKNIYDVGVAGAAGRKLDLSGSVCPPRVVERGTYLFVKSFDVKKKRYLVETIDGGCGWVSGTEQKALSETILNLPWAN